MLYDNNDESDDSNEQLYIYCTDVSYTNFVKHDENKQSTIIQFLNVHTIRT